MRELHAIRSLLVKALENVHDSRQHIRTVRLAVGELSELDRDALEKHWSELSRGTAAEQARLHFRSIPGEVQCMACFEKYHPVGGKIHCPYCGSYGAKVLSGEEFYLEAVELDER